MPGDFTRSALDRLGSRLSRADRPSEEDEALYFDYREGFREAFDEVVQRLSIALPDYHPSGRRKTLDSVIGKMQRQRTRLSTMQDIAGCRIVVPRMVEQNEAVEAIQEAFDTLRTDDLRDSRMLATGPCT